VTDEGTGNENLQKIDVKGSLSFDRKGSVNVQGDIVAGSLTNPDIPMTSRITGDLKAINFRVTEGDVGNKKGADFSVQGNLVLTGQFDVAEGSILGMDVGKSMQASSIIVREGYIQGFGTGEDLTSTVQVLKGSIQNLTVGRDFLPPPGAKQGDALVSVKQSLEYLSVGRNLGKVGTTAFGKIVAQAIGQVIVEGGDMTASVETTSGNIGKVSAMYGLETKTGGAIYGNVTAIDGNVGKVTALEIYGNIEAKGTGADDLSGNIDIVSATTILASKSITADTAIWEISVTQPEKPVTTAIRAQGGGFLVNFFDGQSLALRPLQLEIGGKIPFQGSVVFTYGNIPLAGRIVFAAPQTALLKYTFQNKITSWSVKQTAGNDPGVYVKNATFAFKNKNPLVKGAAFTKINTANTPTTDFTVSQD
jgi:hypothetical protein